MLQDLTSPHFWRQFGLNVARVIEIAFAFELLVLAANYQVGRLLRPALALDTKRDPAWRLKRREWLRRAPRGLLRAILYTAGVLVILEVFQARTAPLYLMIALVTIAGTAACWSLLRDAAWGYALLLEDALAPGDEVEVGDVCGTVDSVGWRAVRLRTESGKLHTVCHGQLRQLAVKSPARPAKSPGGSGA